MSVVEWSPNLAWVLPHLRRDEVPDIVGTRMQDGSMKTRHRTTPRKCLVGEVTMTGKQTGEFEEFANKAIGQLIRITAPEVKEALIVAFAGKPQRLSQRFGGDGMLRECTMRIELSIMSNAEAMLG
jgi:hypothetical protein